MTRLALFGGVTALLLGLACDALAAVVWKDYDFISQSNSELTAIGAPTRPVVVALLVAQSLLVVGFGLAAWTQAGSNTAVRITAGLVTAYGVTGFAAQFFPTALGERPAFFTPGVLLGAAGVLVSVLAIACAPLRGTTGSASSRSGSSSPSPSSRSSASCSPIPGSGCRSGSWATAS